MLWAAAFNFVAFAFFGTEVADTIGQTVEQGWNYATWWLGMPTSSSQVLIGGLVGAGLAKGGLEAIKASSVQKAALFMVLSPLAGLLLAAVLLWAIKLLFGRTEANRTERGFRWGSSPPRRRCRSATGPTTPRRPWGHRGPAGRHRLPGRGRREADHPPVGGAVGARRYRPRDAVGRLADRPHHGPAHHRAAAG